MRRRIPCILLGLVMTLAFLLPQSAMVAFAADNTIEVKGSIYDSSGGGGGGTTPTPTPGGGTKPTPAPDDGATPPPVPGGGETSNPTTGGNSTHTPGGTTGPKTGDNFNVDLYILLLAGSILLLIIILATRRKEDEVSQTES